MKPNNGNHETAAWRRPPPVHSLVSSPRVAAGGMDDFESCITRQANPSVTRPQSGPRSDGPTARAASHACDSFCIPPPERSPKAIVGTTPPEGDGGACGTMASTETCRPPAPSTPGRVEPSPLGGWVVWCRHLRLGFSLERKLSAGAAAGVPRMT